MRIYHSVDVFFFLFTVLSTALCSWVPSLFLHFALIKMANGVVRRCMGVQSASLVYRQFAMEFCLYISIPLRRAC